MGLFSRFFLRSPFIAASTLRLCEKFRTYGSGWRGAALLTTMMSSGFTGLHHSLVAYSDIFGYTFWPSAYDESYWAFVYDFL
jgi:hypothetical protein